MRTSTNRTKKEREQRHRHKHSQLPSLESVTLGDYRANSSSHTQGPAKKRATQSRRGCAGAHIAVVHSPSSESCNEVLLPFLRRTGPKSVDNRHVFRHRSSPVPTQETPAGCRPLCFKWTSRGSCSRCSTRPVSLTLTRTSCVTTSKSTWKTLATATQDEAKSESKGEKGVSWPGGTTARHRVQSSSWEFRYHPPLCQAPGPSCVRRSRDHPRRPATSRPHPWEKGGVPRSNQADASQSGTRGVTVVSRRDALTQFEVEVAGRAV